MIKLENISKTYGAKGNKVTALDNINITLQNEFVSIIGPSGSGKTTLLNIMSGLDKPTKGRVIINNKNICKLSDNELSKFRRENIGFIFQSFNLLPILTVEENIKMLIWLNKTTLDETYYNQIIEDLDLKKRLNHLPNELSGGQQQRVAIARALITKPTIIFADEPTGNLDTAATASVMDILKNIVKQFNTTLIMITHNLDIANSAKKILSITDGTLSEVR